MEKFKCCFFCTLYAPPSFFKVIVRNVNYVSLVRATLEPHKHGRTTAQIRNKRLILRSIRKDDWELIFRLGGDRDIASTTSLPHPYPEERAKEYVDRQPKSYKEGQSVNFAICAKDEKLAKEIGSKKDELMGIVGFYLNLPNKRAELGYWLGKPFWGKGIMFESAKAIMEYGFDHLQLNRIYANHIKHNLASGQILKKLGMQFEGTFSQHFLKFGTLEDSLNYAILADEWKRKRLNDQR